MPVVASIIANEAVAGTAASRIVSAARKRNRWLRIGGGERTVICNQWLQEGVMEFGSIEREIYVEAAPEIVFDVVSSPDHLKQWWPDDARYEPVPGATGEIVFGDCDAGGKVVPFTVVDARPPRLFSFRWTHQPGETAAAGNSLLVTFDLTPSGDGTVLKMTETGFREMGWEAAVLEETYRDHVSGWAHFLPRLVPYVSGLGVRP